MSQAPEGSFASPLLPNRNRNLLTSAALIGGATVLVKLAAFGKDWLLARQFGASDDLDAFWIAFLAPSFAVAVAANAIASAFLPAYTRVASRQGDQNAARLAGATLLLGVAILLIACGLLVGAAHWYLPWLGRGFDDAKLALTQNLLNAMALILVASGASSILAAVLNARERFRVAALAPLAIPIASIVALLVGYEQFGVMALATGTVVGFFLETAILAVAVWLAGWIDWPRWNALGDELSRMGWQLLHVAAGATLFCATTLVDQAMAASLGSGQVSVFNYANKIVALALNVVGISLTTVLFPRFAHLIANFRWVELRRLIGGYAQAIVWLSLPFVALLAYFSEPLVRLLFERGAFTPQTTAEVSHVQLYFLPQIPFYVLALLGARLLSALDSNPTLLRIAAFNLVLNIAGNLIFMHWLGAAGIALSTSLRYFLSSIVMLWAVRLRLAEATVRAPANEETIGTTRPNDEADRS